MKKAWYSKFEGLKGPLVMYFIGMILLGVGNTITSSNVILSNMLEAFRYAGALIKQLFPFFLVINVIGKTHEDSVPILGGVFSYIIIHLTTMYVAPQNLPASYYSSLGKGLLEMVGESTGRSPINLGLIASIISIVIVMQLYKLSRQRFNYGVFTFIDNDTWFMVSSILASILAGILCSWSFRYYVNAMNILMNFVSGNSTNPAALFVYGIMERFMEILGIDEVLHNNFWFGLQGGSWTDLGGNIWYGDVNIWTVQIAQGSVQLGIGKYITPYFIFNMFLIPGMIMALVAQYSNKLERNRVIGLAIIAVIVSLISGSLLPMEYLLLLVAPALLVILIIITALLFMILSMLNVFLGYSFSDYLAFATPGTLLDFIQHNSYLIPESRENFFLVGGICLIVGIIIVFLYYRVLAFDFLEPSKKKMERKEIVKALGGVNNIRVVDASPVKISVAVMDGHKIKASTLMELGAYEVREAFFCYHIFFGPASVSIAREIKKEMKEYKKINKFIENK